MNDLENQDVETAASSAAGEPVETQETTNTDATAPSSSATDDPSAPSTEGDTPSILKAAEEAEARLMGEEAPPATTQTETGATPSGAAAKKDEPAKANGDGTDTDALSQEQEQEFNKRFAERPEWQSALKLAGTQNEKQMRRLLRGIYQRENSILGQVEKLKPAGTVFDRLRRSVGDEGVEGSIALIESWQRGDPKAREILVTLLNDLDQRTGQVLSSPDLLKRSEAIDAKVAQGLMEDDEAKAAKADLLELEKSRASSKQQQTRQKQTAQQQEQERFQRDLNEIESAANAWEATKLGQPDPVSGKVGPGVDPDYPKIRKLVTDRAYLLGNEKQNQLGRMMNGAELRNVLDEALKQIKAEVGGLQPKPEARRPITGGTSSVTTRRKAASLSEAIAQRAEELES